MEELQEKIKQLATGLKDLVECPVCFGTMDSALKQCINGHGICDSCVSKIEKCPTCQQDLSTVCQNTLLGQVLERLPKLCPYSDKGCDTVVFDQEHQRYCEYRPTKCKKLNCEWEGCVKDLLDHVRDCFKGKKVIEVSLNYEKIRVCTIKINETSAHFSPIILQDHVFWKYSHRNGETKFIYHKLYSIPTSKQNCDYFMVVAFKNGDIEYKHTCKAQTDVESNCDENNLVESGIVIPDSDLEYFRKIGTENKYSYTIKLVKKDKAYFESSVVFDLLSDEQGEKIKQFVTSLEELIECPVCFCTMDSTLKQCLNGHGVCSTCVRKVEKCPTCQEKIIVQQSTLLGQILDRLPKMCVYADNGCKVVVFDKDHECNCKYKPFITKVKILYVRNLTPNCSVDKLKKAFEVYGTVETVKKMKDYALIHFKSRDSAVAAMEALNGVEMFDGSAIQVSLPKPPSDNKKKEEILRARETRMIETMQQRGGGFSPQNPNMMGGLRSGTPEGFRSAGNLARSINRGNRDEPPQTARGWDRQAHPDINNYRRASFSKINSSNELYSGEDGNFKSDQGHQNQRETGRHHESRLGSQPQAQPSANGYRKNGGGYGGYGGGYGGYGGGYGGYGRGSKPSFGNNAQEGNGRRKSDHGHQNQREDSRHSRRGRNNKPFAQKASSNGYGECRNVYRAYGRGKPSSFGNDAQAENGRCKSVYGAMNARERRRQPQSDYYDYSEKYSNGMCGGGYRSDSSESDVLYF